MSEIQEAKFWGKLGLGAYEFVPPPNQNFVATPLAIINESRNKPLH